MYKMTNWTISFLINALLLHALILSERRVSGDTQETVDYLARELDIRYDVLDNMVNEDKSFLQRITLKNKGNREIVAGNWSIFFFQIRSINNLKPLKLDDCGMIIDHVSGSLYRLTPDNSTFKTILPNNGNSVKCEFLARYWSVATTDNMPNWYVWSEGTEAKVIQSTEGESLSFVGPYDTRNKWKRYPNDQYDPFSLGRRYNINRDVMDIRGVEEGTYIIPSAVNFTQNRKKSVSISHGNGWVVQDNPDFSKEIKLIADFYNIPIQMTKRKTKVIIIRKTKVDVLKNGSSDEAYHLVITSNNNVIIIKASKNKGAFYAIQTLKRLSIEVSSKMFKVYEAQIEDEPRFEFRGVFLDVGRNFHSKEELKTMLDIMSVYKMNKLLLHLSEDEGWRLEIPGLEELTTIGSKRCHDLTGTKCLSPEIGSGPGSNNSGTGYYTVSDYQDILRYANERHITVIPEFDMPGHANAAIVAMKQRNRLYKAKGNGDLGGKYLLHDPDDKSEYMSAQWFTENAINPCIQSTYNFIDHLVAEVQKMHSGVQDLEIFSFGGDEVAKGAWEKSPKCTKLLESNSEINSTSDLKEYFARRVGNITGKYKLDISGWEDGLMNGKHPFNLSLLVPAGRQVYTSAWDNVWERGGGDRSYRLANAGFKVVLALATHLYFDHPYEPDPSERGYYWATRYTDTRKTFGFIPDNIYANADVKRDGSPLSHEDICGGDTCYQLTKPENIIGMMALVWSETSRTEKQLHDRYFPRFLAASERAWHKASWEDIENKHERAKMLSKDWSRFASRLGHSELKFLDQRGIQYRIPLPGATTVGDKVVTNIAFPGLVVEHSIDDQHSWTSSKLSTISGNKMHFRTRSADGRRTSRVITLSVTTSTALRLGGTFYELFLTSFILVFSSLYNVNWQ